MSRLFPSVASRALLVWWLAIVLLMALNAAFAPAPPSPRGGESYGYNHPGVFWTALLLSVAELLVLLAVLRPWSYRDSWGRSLVALILLTPWTFLNFVATMHAGGVLNLHVLWLLGAWLAMPVATIRGLELRGRRVPARE